MVLHAHCFQGIISTERELCIVKKEKNCLKSQNRSWESKKDLTFGKKVTVVKNSHKVSVKNIKNLPMESEIVKVVIKYTPLAKLLARQARLGMPQDGSGNKAESYSSISATNQH